MEYKRPAAVAEAQMELIDDDDDSNTTTARAWYR
jgi:hypothetical protein